jgi:Mg-chelatase subunit ChlD
MFQLAGVRRWAFWRRVQYGTGYALFLVLVLVGGYLRYVYEAPTCFDSKMNGEELAVDCGGSCTRICAFTVKPPRILWAESFPANAGQYNAVAYVENSNPVAGTPELRYTFTLKDRDGVITTRQGVTALPPESTYPVFEGRIDTGGRVPTETILTLESADLWLPVLFGRTQFRTSDLALTGADARPRLAVEIENTELSAATDVEVVATIFNAAGIPLTASQTFISQLPGRSTRDITFTWPQPIAKTLRSCEIPTDVIVAIDLSGSMNNDSANPPQPISDVLRAAETFITELRRGDQVGLTTFASTASLQSPLTTSTAAVAAQVRSLVIAPSEERGTTNTGDALVAAESELNSTRHNTNARSVVVLLTDGLATAPGDDPNAYALAKAASLRAGDVTVFAIGLGAGVNADFLKGIATTPDQAFVAPTTATLQSIYETITASICEEGAARIDVIPKTRSNFAPLEPAL